MQIKRFNWFRKVSAWEHAEARRAQTQRMVQTFNDNAALAAAAFTGAQNNLSSGLSTIAAQRLAVRVQQELAATKDSVSKLA